MLVDDQLEQLQIWSQRDLGGREPDVRLHDRDQAESEDGLQHSEGRI